MGCNRDYRSVPTNPSERDTFKLLFVAFERDSSVFFSWPDVSYLGVRCDSMFFVFTDSAKQVDVIDMFKQDSLQIANANARGITSAFIYKYGVKLVDDVDDPSSATPKGFALLQNYPNPFNPATEISYMLEKSSNVTLTVYDILGRDVAVLVNGRIEQGEHTLRWDAQNVPSGVYFYRLSAGGFVQTKRMILLK
jgi:hypothetical protein